MVKYSKEKHKMIELHNITNSELKEIAKKQRRSVNNLINVALEEYIKRNN